ncbi:MAG: hypothetical protein A2017_21625 [Lentisphaerae bacterium GWF2_44_16]|nr:MAG: hypothetical protein A2017_21625 [Lentisphaerae bacterium GWF2_44_16]
MKKNKKEEVVSFKADDALLKAIKGIRNRSEFIRSAILSALDCTCPLCKGTGTLTQHQRAHWAIFTQNHTVRECESCHGIHLSCTNDKGKRSIKQ